MIRLSRCGLTTPRGREVSMQRSFRRVLFESRGKAWISLSAISCNIIVKRKFNLYPQGKVTTFHNPQFNLCGISKQQVLENYSILLFHPELQSQIITSWANDLNLKYDCNIITHESQQNIATKTLKSIWSPSHSATSLATNISTVID